jgi:two-component sensor histidine kinase
MAKLYRFVSLFLIAFSSCNRGSTPVETNLRLKNDAEETEKLIARQQEFKFNHIDSLLIIANKLDSFGKLYNKPTSFVYANIFRANYYYQSGNYITSMAMSLKALNGAEKQHLEKKLPEIYALIGNLHKENANYPMAMQAAANGLNAAEAIKDTDQIIQLQGLKAMFTNSYGRRTNDDSLISKAFQMQLQTLRIAESSPKYERLRIRFYDNISQYYLEGNDFDRSIAYGKKGAELSLKYNAIRSLTYSYSWMGMSYYHLNQKEKGIQYLNQALALSKQLKEPFRTVEIYGFIYKCFILSGDYKNAFENYRLMNSLNDSLKLVNNTRQLGELQIKYEAAKKDNQIIGLKRADQVKSRQMGWIIAGLVLAVMVVGVISIQYYLISKKNRFMAMSARTMNEQAEKLQVLIKELHHRVKNNLQIVSSLLSLQSNRLTDPDARSAIKLGQQRIEAISLIHRNLYQQENPTAVNMKEFVTDLTESILASFGIDRDDFDLDLEISVIDLDVDVALPLGLIINEWITNAFKHAYGSQQGKPGLWIKLSADKNLELKIKDNGKGMPMEIWETPQRSFGVKLVKVLTKQLRGNCHIENRNGTILTLDIPRAAVKNLKSA